MGLSDINKLRDEPVWKEKLIDEFIAGEWIPTLATRYHSHILSNGGETSQDVRQSIVESIIRRRLRVKMGL